MLLGSPIESLKTYLRVTAIIGITLTLVVFCLLCTTPRKHHVSVLFVTNLLISNLVLICSFFPLELMNSSTTIGVTGFFVAGLIIGILLMICLLFALMIGHIFRMCIAVERYMIITHPTYIRPPRTSVLACVVPWVLCVLIFCILLYTYSLTAFAIALLIVTLSTVLSVIFVVLTFVALPAASSVPIEEKRRTVGISVLLLVDYILLIISVLLIIFDSDEYAASFVLAQLTVFVDLALSVLMFNGPVDRFLSRLLYCMTDNSVTTDVTLLICEPSSAKIASVHE